MSTVTVALRQAGGRGDKAGSHDTVVPMGEESVLPAARYSLCPRRSMARLTTSGKPPSSVTPSARHYARIKDTRCSRAGIDTESPIETRKRTGIPTTPISVGTGLTEAPKAKGISPAGCGRCRLSPPSPSDQQHRFVSATPTRAQIHLQTY